MVPVLRFLSDGAVVHVRDIRDAIAQRDLTETQRELTLPSGAPQAYNRIGWAVSYLSRVEALVRVRRGEYTIGPVGHAMLAQYPDGITEAQLRTYARPDDKWWIPSVGARDTRPVDDTMSNSALDPTEQIEQGISRIDAEVAADLLSRLHGAHPTFFEHAVIDLLVAMGYGGADGQARVTSPGNDGGIDGIIDQDALGLSRVYVQAKRYAPTSSVQRPELQAFVGALSGKADGGVFITTGRFSSGAVAYTESIPARIILIDGGRLTDLMIKYGVGVQVRRTVHIVEVDEDFFD
jgi:restriction system protein